MLSLPLMTTGDESQLGGQAFDNAPMIGCVRTRVMVSARRAYTAGNLRGLTEMLNEEKQFVPLAWPQLARSAALAFARLIFMFTLVNTGTSLTFIYQDF